MNERTTFIVFYGTLLIFSGHIFNSNVKQQTKRETIQIETQNNSTESGKQTLFICRMSKLKAEKHPTILHPHFHCIFRNGSVECI